MPHQHHRQRFVRPSKTGGGQFGPDGTNHQAAASGGFAGSALHTVAAGGAGASANAGGSGGKVQWASPIVVPAAAAKTVGTHAASGTPKAAPAIRSTRAMALVVGIHAPASKLVIGDVIGIAGQVRECWNCSKPGHYKGECPVAYGREGKPLPGWDKDGERKPGAWNGDEPKKATYKAWVRFLSDKNNFPSGQAEVAGLREAATLADFQERADNARP